MKRCSSCRLHRTFPRVWHARSYGPASPETDASRKNQCGCGSRRKGFRRFSSKDFPIEPGLVPSLQGLTLYLQTSASRPLDFKQSGGCWESSFSSSRFPPSAASDEIPGEIQMAAPEKVVFNHCLEWDSPGVCRRGCEFMQILIYLLMLCLYHNLWFIRELAKNKRRR